MQEHKVNNIKIHKLDKNAGCGSSLAILDENSEEVIFYMLTDRGPNTDGPEIDGCTSKIFIEPEFNPHIKEYSLTEEEGEFIGEIGLKKNGAKLNGLPIKNQTKTFEISLDSSLDVMGYYNDGIDPEGVAVDSDKNIWVGEEYGPTVIKFDSMGNELLRLLPGKGLPRIFNSIYPNRGFEAITVGDNKVYIAAQSTLDFQEKTRYTGVFIRIIEIEIDTFVTKEYGYLFDNDEYENNIDAKIGDIEFLEEDTLLLIEQGKSKVQKNGLMHRNIVYKISLKGATDLSKYRVDGNPPEYFENILKLRDIEFIKKNKVLNLNDMGWNFYKAEGIAVSKDRKRIFVINDNDFSVDVRFKDENGENLEGKIYEYRLEDDMLIDKQGKKYEIRSEFFDTKENLELWEIVFDDTI